jgi:uncharacterized membrane protein
MGIIPLAIATLMYVLTALDLAFVQGNLPMAFTFAAYALANIGLMIAAYAP